MKVNTAHKPSLFGWKSLSDKVLTWTCCESHPAGDTDSPELTLYRHPSSTSALSKTNPAMPSPPGNHSAGIRGMWMDFISVCCEGSCEWGGRGGWGCSHHTHRSDGLGMFLKAGQELAFQSVDLQIVPVCQQDHAAPFRLQNDVWVPRV